MAPPNQSRETITPSFSRRQVVNPTVKKEEYSPVLTWGRDLSKPPTPHHEGGHARSPRQPVVLLPQTRTTTEFQTTCHPLKECIAYQSAKYLNNVVPWAHERDYIPCKSQVPPLWWHKPQCPVTLYVPFEDANMSPGMRGVSLARILVDESVSIRGSSDHILDLPCEFTLNLRINGFAPSQETISVVCQHGPMSRKLLVVTIARTVANYMRGGGSKRLTHAGFQEKLQSPILFDQLRLTGLYRFSPHNLPNFELDFFYVERRVDSRV